MLFNSYEFLIFFPLVWTTYFLLNRCGFFKIALVSLVFSSFIFYGFWDHRLCFLLAVSILANYLVHICLIESKKTFFRKMLLLLGLLFNFSLLFYFKYLDFTLENINRLFHTQLALKNIVLPLGISFYTFQQVSFVIDSYYRETEKYPFLEYCAFVAFFPQLVAGPIVLHQEIVPQLQDRTKKKIDYANLMSGIEYFILGFVKKVLVADQFARFVNMGYEDVTGLNSLTALLTILSYTLEIYFDFSGYCDMALGLGYCFNLILPVNFSSPYKAKNIAEFWDRWHMTLTRFLTKYLYIPLGGSRRGLFRTCVNVMIVFTVSGLWHGAAWTFVLWGILHGAAMVLWRLCRKWMQKLPELFLWTCTFLFINVTWAFFRAEYFRQPFRLIRRIFAGGFKLPERMITNFCEHFLWRTVLAYFLSAETVLKICQTVVVLWFIFWTGICIKAPSSHELVAKKNRSTGWFLLLSILFVRALWELSQVSEFIYFNF